jgi:plasmid stability protein
LQCKHWEHAGVQQSAWLKSRSRSHCQAEFRAARHGRSAEAEHREILRQALETEREPTCDDLALELRKLTASRKQAQSELLLRQGRDER